MALHLLFFVDMGIIGPIYSIKRNSMSKTVWLSILSSWKTHMAEKRAGAGSQQNLALLGDTSRLL